MIKVMIAEDNQSLCENCFEFLTNDEDIKVVSCTLDGKSTLEKYLEIKPDVLLLDLDLPKITGIEVINFLSRFSEERDKCNIIVVSGSVELLSTLCNTAQVYRVIRKPANMQYILDSIKEISFRPTEIDQKKLKKLLTSLRFKVYSNNVSYLITAINVAYERPYLLNNIKDLYSVVASIHNLSPTTIKWSIRNSIGALNRSTTIDEICSIFAINHGIDSMTPKQFITLVLEYFEK